MENIYLNKVKETPHSTKKIRKISYQTATDSLIILHQDQITKYSFHAKNYHFDHAYTTPHIQQLQIGTVLLLQQLVEDERILVVNGQGSIFTVEKGGEVDIKAQNEDGITAASLSPTQEYLYIATNNKSLIQLNKEFDLVSEIPMDQQQQVVNSLAQFSWRPDGNFFVLNYRTVNGNKAVTKDIMMNTHTSPAKSDPNADGLVQSVSEKGKKAMSGLVSWQPSGSIIAGADFVQSGDTRTNRVIFWEKNGLRHLQFTLNPQVQCIKDLFWSFDSSILFVEVQTKLNREVLIYYRSNYHWYLKNAIALNQNDRCLVLSSRQYKHKILIVHNEKFQILQYQLRLPQKQFRLEQQQSIYKHQFQYFVDGAVVNITDLSKCFMPPPMSMFKHDFGSKILGINKRRHNIVAVSSENVFLYDIIKSAVVLKCQIGDLQNQRVFDLQLMKNDEIVISVGSKQYQHAEGTLRFVKQLQKQEQVYKLTYNQEQITLKVAYNNQQLVINGKIISQECSSYIIYHQFLLFTVSTSHMYDKLYVVNFALEDWVFKAQCNVKSKLSDYQTRDTLNHRLTERGSKILAITEGRVVFQLPRGNLQGIYPKIIMINRVKKCIQSGKYRQAFQTIRTHKLDFNLIFDINTEKFKQEIDTVLLDLKRVDFINLLIAQINQTYSSQMQYVLSSKAYEANKDDFQLALKGKKVKQVCGVISRALRVIDKDKYILSIYTSEIREGKLNDVLFEIKELKKDDIEIVLPPHIIGNGQKKKKVMSPQQILEYVCWLVDANAIYEASLLTYDLELAAITARCTQKDPKEYMPYHEQLEKIEDQVQFKKRICLDLKKYNIAAKQLAKGSPQQIAESLQLIRKHKLYKDGLIIYSQKQELKEVKSFIVEELLATGQTNEAYRVCQSIGLNEKALSIAKGAMDTKKIKQCIEIVLPTSEERKLAVLQIINHIKDQIKNRIDLARLYAYVQQYEEAVRIYLKHNDYRKAYKYLGKVSEEFRRSEMKQGFQLCFSVKRNDIIRDKKDFIEKYTRLKKVHKHKAEFGEPTTFRPRQNDDMYSEVSMSSRAQSSYTISTTTGMRKKKDKKRSILTRNVKEGSLLEEQYLLAYIKTLQDKVQDAVKDSKLLIQHLICLNLVEQAQTMRNEVRDYIENFTTFRAKSFAKTKYEELHPQAAELYYQPHKLENLTIDSFNYLF